jgi:Xaa-Pro aminopeptidase
VTHHDLSIYREKLHQAHGLLESLDLDSWLIFVRETSMMGDPALRLIAPFDLTWESALIIFRDGARVAIVGRYDVQPVESSGLFDQVIGYDASMAESLRDVLMSHDPRQIAINYSTSEVAADGLTHGMYLRLQELLDGTSYGERLTSAHELASRLRAVKTPGELDRLRAAIDAAGAIFDAAARSIKVGVTERAISDLMHAAAEREGMGMAWHYDACPIVNTGPESPVGHAIPTDLTVQRGHLVHIDFGVVRDSYCSDQQRMWYVMEDGEASPPDEVQRAWQVVRAAIERGFAAIKPGLQGWQIDEIAREMFREAGLPEYQHALGHGVGRAVHDGGTLLGPRWDRYGQTPYGLIEPGMVFTLECGVETSRGYLGLEEEIVVEQDGARWLSPPQTELWLIRDA